LGQAKTVLLRLCDEQGRLSRGDREPGATRNFTDSSRHLRRVVTKQD
jgi:hypothetical protein